MARHLAVVTPLPPIISGIADYGYFLTTAIAGTDRFERITVLTDTTQQGSTLYHPSFLSIEPIWQRNSVSSGWQIAIRLQALKPDLVWYNLGVSSFGTNPLSNLSGLLSMALVSAAGLPTVVTLHEVADLADLKALQVFGGIFIPFGKWLFRNLSAYADVICVTLQHHADWLTQHQIHTNVIHIPHGAYDVQTLQESQGIEILMFASCAPFKGFEQLLTVFHQIRQVYPELRLTIVGGEHPRFPGYRDRLQRIYGNCSAIQWLGFVPEHQLREVFSRATLVVLPYTATTGSSSVLYRAVAWGRPVIASDLPELRATAEEQGLHVQFFTSGDQTALSASLLYLLSNPELRAAQADHNLRIIASRLTLSDTCRAYLKAFDIALASQKRWHSLFRISSQS